ncbi:MAG TPA: hypothetical protein V6D05_02355 [Stenomitos sp.]
MNERLIMPARVGRRPLTFAHTRPLSPTDLSGITGLLADEAPKAQVAPRGIQKAVAFFKGLMAR